MSLAALFDHVVRVYRASRARDASGDPVLTWSAQGSASSVNNARPEIIDWTGALQNRGAGDEQVIRRRWLLAADLAPREHDVLNVTSGPETGKKLRVHAVIAATMPIDVHHYECEVEPWEGSL